MFLHNFQLLLSLVLRAYFRNNLEKPIIFIGDFECGRHKTFKCQRPLQYKVLNDGQSETSRIRATFGPDTVKTNRTIWILNPNTWQRQLSKPTLANP